MDSSTHSTSSQPLHNTAAANNAAAAAAATNANAANGPTPSSTTGGSSSPKRGPPPQQQQLLKLREANTKYKNLLKLAKERIQEQEGLLDERRSEVKQLSTKLTEATEQIDALRVTAGGSGGGTASTIDLNETTIILTAGGSGGGTASTIDLNETTIIRVCQRIKDEIIDDNADDAMMDTTNDDGEDNYEIWALIEYETSNSDGGGADASSNPLLNAPSYKRYKQWQKFVNESALSDYIRRDTGEPLTLPPYSLSPEQSQKMVEEAKKSVAVISEEFRRFRVRAEVAKKQADATVRALHTNSVQTTRMRIEGQDIE
ncbi:LOW QUALITY PROTEIN: hypothetical protein ACHAWC_000883, partial [Mediolabrus comicus]